MTHLVSPSAYRVGKTFLWKQNSLSFNTNFSRLQENSATSKTGLNLLLKHSLKRKRLFVVKNSITYHNKLKLIKIFILFAPRIKTKPKSDARGNFSRFVLYKKFDWSNNFILQAGKKYVDERRLKTYKSTVARKMKINKWLTRRMFRGSKRVRFYARKKKLLFYRFKNLQNSSWNSYLSKSNVARSLKVFKKLKIKSPRQVIFLQNTKYKMLYRRRWWRNRSALTRQLNTYKLSYKYSNILKQNVKVNVINVFNYMAIKQMIGFRSHQEHFWNKNFRRFRFFYNNYFDIVNSFFILGLIKNSEMLLLDILRIMMPRIRKIRRFMFFLDAVVKNLYQIQKNFSVFRITISGKIRGGTERTKTFTVGFGHLPYQSLTLEGSTAFISYPHKFGEFGIRLTMNRTQLKVKPTTEFRWLAIK